MPVGKVTHVEGGYRLSGRWNFSSGSMHCKWVMLGGVVPPQAAGDAPDYRTFLVPISDYPIVENWDVSGLEGTGSHDIVVEDVFVPEYRTHRSIDGFMCDSPGNKVNTSPLYRLPFGQIFVRAVCSSSIGALQAALDSFIKINRDRVGLNDAKRVAQDPGAQAAAAQATSVIDECRTIMARNFDLMYAAAAAGTQLPIEQRIKMRYDASLVAPKCAARSTSCSSTRARRASSGATRSTGRGSTSTPGAPTWQTTSASSAATGAPACSAPRTKTSSSERPVRLPRPRYGPGTPRAVFFRSVGRALLGRVSTRQGFGNAEPTTPTAPLDIDANPYRHCPAAPPPLTMQPPIRRARPWRPR